MTEGPDHRPLVGVTMGDPAGIGPEIVVRALTRPELYRSVRPLVLGDEALLARAAEICGVKVEVNVVDAPAAGRFVPGVVDLIPVTELPPEQVPFGRVSPEAGRACFEYIKKSVELALAGRIDAVATAPVNKAALQAAGVPYLDHTQAYAALTGATGVLTMFVVGDRLKIFFATRHVSLRQAIAELTVNRVYEVLVLADRALRRFGFGDPRLALAALNPHAGEGGLFGDEEITVLAPAVERARAAGVRADGPIPADSVFYLCLQGRYDAVVSLYHDQGHIAAKTYDFDRTVSLTTGLPFVRTSVDHGTAYDIAGRGIARAESMAEAVRVAGEYARRLWAASRSTAGG
jgi:4-hydroxythreonine-4-phosphate dehydrogenase